MTLHSCKFLDGPLAGQVRMTNTFEWPLPTRIAGMEMSIVLGPGEWIFAVAEEVEKKDLKMDVIYRKVSESQMPQLVGVLRGAAYELEQEFSRSNESR